MWKYWEVIRLEYSIDSHSGVDLCRTARVSVFRTFGIRLQDMRKRLRYYDLLCTVHRMADGWKIRIGSALECFRRDRSFGQHVRRWRPPVLLSRCESLCLVSSLVGMRISEIVVDVVCYVVLWRLPVVTQNRRSVHTTYNSAYMHATRVVDTHMVFFGCCCVSATVVVDMLYK